MRARQASAGGTKRTFEFVAIKSAFDPKRTSHQSRRHVGICTDSPPRRVKRHLHPLALGGDVSPRWHPQFVGTRLHRAYTAHEQVGGTLLRTY